MNEPDQLNQLLNRWDTAPSEQPRFAAQVQERIESTNGTGAWAKVLAFPATLPLAAGIAIMLGVSAAVSTQRSLQLEQLATAYDQSIDPIQMTGHSGH